MDLGTVKSKLSGSGYETIEDFLDDIQLIWDNCKVYNAQGSVKWRLNWMVFAYFANTMN